MVLKPRISLADGLAALTVLLFAVYLIWLYQALHGESAGRSVRHWLRRKRWEYRWRQMAGWQREAIEQIWGPQEG